LVGQTDLYGLKLIEVKLRFRKCDKDTLKLLGAARNGTISGGIGRSQWCHVDEPLAGIGKYSTSGSKSFLATCV